MCYLLSENWTKFASMNFIDGPDPSVRDALVIKKMNIIDGKFYQLIIYVIIPTKKSINIIKIASVIIASELSLTKLNRRIIYNYLRHIRR